MHLLTIKTIRTAIVKGLRAHTNATDVAAAESGGDKPKYPYIELKFINLGGKVGEAAQFMRNTKQVNEQDRESILSVTCYGQTKDSASDLAYQALEYFEVHGVLPLQEANIAIVDATTLTDRTTLLTTDYEHRIGFDVRLRVRTQVISEVDVIDEVKLTGHVIDFEI